MKKPPNRLSYKFLRNLEDWIKLNTDRFKNTPLDQAEIASVASKELGLTITFSNIRGICDSLGIEVLGGYHPKGSKLPSCDPVARRHLGLLYTIIGESVPPELQDFILADRIPDVAKGAPK